MTKQLTDVIKKAIEDYEFDGYTQHCEMGTCPYCKKNFWTENDVCDYIAKAIRDNFTSIRVVDDNIEVKIDPPVGGVEVKPSDKQHEFLFEGDERLKNLDLSAYEAEDSFFASLSKMNPKETK